MEEITLFLFIRLVRLLVGITSFIGLLLLDVWKAWKIKAHWVPQGALVLSAFSLQLLDLLDTETVSISDYTDVQAYELVRVLQNGLLIDGGRVMVCVYMGYVLPEMARSPSKRVVWSDMGALALSVFTHIFSELYVFKKLYSTLRDANIPVNPLSIVSRVCTMVCATVLFLLLGSAAFAGRTLYNLVFEKIPLVLKEKPANYNPENVEKYALRSWVVAWVCKPDYLIARSVLASSVGVVVTLSVGCFAAEWITQDYKVLHFGDGIDWFRYTVTAFMTLLIFIGWSIIFFRWMFAIFYFPRYNKKPNEGYFHVEDFWIRHILEVMDDIEFPQPSWDQHVSGGGFLQNLNLHVLRALKAHILLRHPLLYLQQRVIWFSKFCSFLSETILFVNKTRSFIVGAVDPHLANFQEALEKVMMPGETKEYLLDGSVKALKQIMRFMEKGHAEGLDSGKLIELLKDGSDQNSEGSNFKRTLEQRLETEASFDYLTKLSWKMTALSLIQVIIELGGNGRDVVEAYSQAYDFLDLLDNPFGAHTIFSPELFVRAADKQFIKVKQQLKQRSPRKNDTMQDAPVKRVRDLQEKATSYDPNDSVDWWAAAVDNSLGKVYSSILRPDGTNSEAQDIDLNKVRRILADILAIAIKDEVGRQLVENCQGWAEILEDEKIKAAVYISGKLKGVIDNLNGVIAGSDRSGRR